MKKIFDKKTIITFIISGIIFGGLGIYAASYLATDISYTPTDSSWEVSNVNEAINSLYDMKKELDNIKNLGDATADDIIKGKTAVIQGELVTGTKVDKNIQIIDLGTATSFNIAAVYNNYANLTISNFYFRPAATISTSNYGFGDYGNIGQYGVKSLNASFYSSYNAATGILTAYITASAVGAVNESTKSASGTAAVHAYLIIK